jgi:hypothetical protein
MALMPADMTVTRQTVYEWIEEWNDSGKSETLEEWVRRHVKELNLPDLMVNTVGHDTLDDITPLDDLIVMDLPSYTNATDSAT